MIKTFFTPESENFFGTADVLETGALISNIELLILWYSGIKFNIRKA